MSKHVSLHRLLIIVLLCSTMTYTNISFANQTNVSNHAVNHIVVTNHRIQHALNMLEKRDNGAVTLTYYRQGQILSFYINDYDDKDQFQGSSLNKQVSYFEHLSGVFSISPQVQITKKAEHNHSIQMSEQLHQRIQNHIDAQRAIAQAKAKAKAKAQAKAVATKAKQRAQAKKKQQAKQKAQQAKKQKLQKQQKQAQLKKRQLQKQRTKQQKGNQHGKSQKQ